MMVSIAAYRLLLHSAFFDWTIVTAFCLDFLPTSSRDSSRFRTLLHGSSSESEDRSILLARSSAFTGCALEDCGYILFATRPDPFLSVSYPSQPVPVRQISYPTRPDPTRPAGLPVTRTRRSIHWNLQFA